MAMCPSVHLSVCLSQVESSVKTAERIVLVFGIQATLNLSYPYTVLEGNSGISKNKGTSLWNFVPNHCTSTVTRVVNLGGRWVW